MPFSTYLTILLIFLGIPHSECRRNYCDFAERINCKTGPQGSLCGSDGKTYYNSCALAVARCHYTELHALYAGQCELTTTTTNPPQPTVNYGAQLAYDIFCIDLSHLQCPRVSQQICASNNATYPNLCEFDKARCTHRHLKLVKYGPC